jgi:hypothetical protein
MGDNLSAEQLEQKHANTPADGTVIITPKFSSISLQIKITNPKM